MHLAFPALPDGNYELRLRSGSDGLKSSAGKLLIDDYVVAFRVMNVAASALVVAPLLPPGSLAYATQASAAINAEGDDEVFTFNIEGEQIFSVALRNAAIRASVAV